MSDLYSAKIRSLMETPANALKSAGGAVADFVQGVVKGNTTDLISLIEGNADIAMRLLGEPAKEIDKPAGDKVFETVSGREVKGNIPEEVGTLISLGGAAKAMIVGAARIGRPVAAAEKMLKEGKSAKEIFDQTGMYQDSDKVFKAAIPDNEARLKDLGIMTLAERNHTTLSNLLSHPKLFEAYPELKNMEVYPMRSTDQRLGGYFPGEKYMDVKVARPQDDVLSVVLHETQHAIQDIEGFAMGGNTRQFLSFDPASVQKKITAGRNSGDAATQKAAERFKAKANEKLQIAGMKYENIPGEQEARFVQATDNLNNEQLQGSLLKMIANGYTPQSWDTQSFADVAAGK